MDVSDAFICIDHATSTMKKIQDHLHNLQLCDVAIIVGNKRLPAHRLVLSSVSEYFRAMFNSNVLEANQDEITLTDIDEEAFADLLKYMYTGKLEICEDNVERMVATANMLRLEDVVDAGCSFLMKQLHPSNCLGIRAFADTQSCHKLLNAAHEYTMDHFTEVTHNKEFLLLPINQVCDLLSSDDVNIPTEINMFEALLRWVKNCEGERRIYMPQLLSHIRLTYMDKEYVADVVQNNPLICDNLACEHQVIQALIHHMLPERRPCVQQPRKSTTGHLYAIGGMDTSKVGFTCATSIERYNARTNRWNQIAHMTGRRLQFGVAVLDDKLYVVGGRDGLKTVNTVECFNSRTKTWSVMPPVGTHRHGLAVAVLKGPMYAVGGHDGWSYLNTVERWDPQARAWNYVAPMSVSRSTVGVAVLMDKLYAVGGRDGSSCLRSVECFDPHTNKWTNCAPMSKRRGGVGVGVCKGHLYAIGGHDAPASNQMSKLSETVERYDPKIDQWMTVASMSVPRDAVGVCVLGTQLYACGGYDGQSYLSTCETYDPQSNEWKTVSPLITGRAGTVLVHIKGME
uniref:Kelch-like protein 5 n=1 Tax=Phallusia mammillata TaxID=59560 RepID=A0A6F9DGY1_9ASCI|nr:kelch-like protein 5 [Phallusia mammillata]